MSDFKETDLYEPVKKLFEGMGFSVYSEVKGRIREGAAGVS